MQKKLIIACLLFCCITIIQSFAQHTIKGTVTDNNSEALAGVTISVKENQSISSSTDHDGNFELVLPNIDTNYTIKASMMGYTNDTKKIQPKQSKKLNFRLNEKEYDLDQVVITGTRTPKLLKDSPVLVKVITENDIKKIDASNIGDLLQSELPGIEFSYSMNQQVSLRMQGFGGNSILFLVDGERIAGETLDNIDYSRLNLDNVERIEIIKGAASTLYGSSAVGGIVNIITRTTTEPWTLNINSRLASHKNNRYGGSVSFNTGKFNSLTNVQHTFQDSLRMNNPGTYSKIFGNQTWNFKERLQFTLNKQFKFIARAGYFFRERNSAQISKDRYRSFNGGLNMNYNIDTKNNLELSYSFDQYDKSDYSTTSRLDVRKYSNVQHNIRTLYNYIFNKNYVLTAGGDVLRDYLLSYQFEKNGSRKQYTVDAFAQIDAKPFDKFNVVAGMRYDYFSDNKVNHISSSLAAMYKINNYSFRASYAGGFRAPSLKEMYMNFFMGNIFMIYGNPNLKSETSQNFLLSAEYTKSYYNFSVTGFYNLVDNRITVAWDQELKGQLYTNMKNISIAGVDANASFRFPCGIGGRLSYIFMNENIKKGQPQVSSSRPHTATARIEYGKHWKDYSFNIMLNGRFLSKVTVDEYTSSTSYIDTKRVTYPDYMLWKLSLLQTFKKGINLTLSVDNLFNYVPSYYYSKSPYTTGTTFLAGLSIDIDKLLK